MTAACQCVGCFRYLATNRQLDGSQLCTDCGGDMPLAKIRGALTDGMSIECLALISEEAAEVQQRIGKILRWGWEADFEGTTQQDKLESELGDQLAALVIAVSNAQVTAYGVHRAMTTKLDKFREDATGPKQRLLRARVPSPERQQAILNALSYRLGGDE